MRQSVLLLLLCLLPVGGRAQGATVDPPMELRCPQLELHLLNTGVNYTCLWASIVTLTYQASASVPTTGVPPTCQWAVDGVAAATTRQWAGTQTLMTPVQGSMITVNYTSATCPGCNYRLIRVSLEDQQVRFFSVASPWGLAVEYEDVALAWCALFKSEVWIYRLACGGGTPSPLTVPSQNHSSLPSHGLQPGQRAQCNRHYTYVARVYYSQAGHYTCSLSSAQGPPLRLSLIHSLEAELLRLLSAKSGVLSPQRGSLQLSWHLSAATAPGGVSYELASQASPGGLAWTVTRHTLASPVGLCAAPRTLGEQVDRALLLVRPGASVQASTGIIHLQNGVLRVSHRGRSFSLTPNSTMAVRAVYYIARDGALYYAKKVPAQHSTVHSLLLRDQDITHFFKLEYRSVYQYTLTAQLYLNRRANLYKAVRALNVSMTLYNSGSARLTQVVHVVWFIPAQHPIIQCAWSFVLNVTHASGASDVQTYSYRQMVSNAATYIPGVTLRFNPRLYAGFMARVPCSSPGQKKARLTASVGNYEPQPADTVVLCVQEACETPQPVIQKPLPPQKTMVVRKGYPFDVYANAGLNCAAIISATLSWKVYLIPNMMTGPDPNMSVMLPSTILSNIATLHIPKLTLDLGLYIFVFHVNLTISDPAVPLLENSDQIYIEVTSSKLVALIAGGSLRTVAYHRTLVLNGLECVDPDSASPHNGVMFTWYCTTKLSDYHRMVLSPGSKCLNIQTQLNVVSAVPQILTLPPRRLKLKKTYHFRLVIQKGKRKSYFDQTIKVLSGNPPETSIDCIENCEKYIIPTERFILSGICSNCAHPDTLKYEWTLVSAKLFTKISFDWSNTATGRSLVYMSVNAKTFLVSEDTSYAFEVKITTADGSSGIAIYGFNINAPPKIGSCSITPKRGIALLTKFTVRCSGFYDSNVPLRYKITAVAFTSSGTISTLQNKALGTIAYFGFDPKSPPIVLPVGVSTGRRLLLIQVQVFDDLGAYSSVELKVRVDDLTVSSLHDSIVDKLLTIVEGNTAPLTILLHGTDYVEVNQLYYIVASVLNDRNFKGEELTKVIQFRQTILGGAASMEATSSLLITQIAASIFEITKKKKEVSEASQVLAAAKLKDLSAHLYNYTLGNIGSESTESLSAGIMTAGANVMAAFLLPFPKGGTEAGINLTSDQLEVTNKVFLTLRSLTQSVSIGKVPGEINTFMKVKEWKITIKKNEKEDVEDSYFTDTNCLNCIYPSLLMPVNDSVSSAVYEFEDNPMPWLGKSANIVTDVIAFDMFVTQKNGDVKDLYPKMLETILLRKIKVEPKRIKLAKDMVKIGVIIGEFKVGIDPSKVSEAFIQLVTEQNPIFEVKIYSGKDSAAQSAAQTRIIPDCEPGETILKGRTFHIWDPYTFRIPINLFKKDPDNATGNNYATITVETNYAKARRLLKKGIGVSFFTANCLTFAGKSDKWHTSACKTGILTNNERVHCICKSVRIKSRAVGRLLKFPWFLVATVLVLPEVVDLHDTRKLLDTLPRNVVTIVTVIIIFLLYFLIAMWAFRKQKSDKASVGKVIVLPDNDPCETFCYLVTVYTGSRLDSSTTADVFLTLVSKCFQSDIHHLKHPDHQIFLRAGVDTFLVTTEEDLGDLTSIRVWCKTAGHSPTWYLSRVKVQNVVTKQFWFFLCRKWFAAAKGDGLLDRTFPAIHPEAFISRRDAFLIDYSTNIETDHLWFSVFTLKSDPNFTRFQRLSCCLTMLLSSLLTSIMLYQKEVPGPVLTRLLRSVVIGIESALVMVPVQILTAGLFVYAQKEKAKYARLADAKHQYEEFQKAHYEIIEQEPKLDKLGWGPVHSKNWKDRLQKWYVDDEAEPKIEGDLNEPTKAADDDIYNLLSYNAGLDKVENQPRKAFLNCTMPQSIADKITIDDTAAETDANTKKYSKSSHVDQHSSTKLKVNKSRKARHSLQREGKVSLQWKEDNHSLKGEKEKHSLKLEESSLDSSNMVLHKKTSSRLPFYVLCFAWFIVCAVSITAAVFIIVYGLHYGLLISWHWLLASVTSFLQGILILQPLKIAAFSLLYVWHRRHAREIDWFTRTNWLQTDVEKMYKISAECCAIIPKEMQHYRAPNPDELIIAKRQDVIRKKAIIFCIRVVIHLLFLVLLLCAISYADYKNSFYYNQIIQIKFSEELSTINTIEQVYIWMTATFLPLIHIDREDNFLTANNYHLVGLPRMRQIRSKQKSVPCFGKNSFMQKSKLGQYSCQPLFDISQQDKREYNGAWTSLVGKESEPVKDPLNYTGWIYENYHSPWFFSSNGDYHNYPLGGYAVYFSSNLQASVGLMESFRNASWIDRSTWAVIIENTIYNPNIDLFCTISVIFEMIPQGAVTRKLIVKSFSLRLFDRDQEYWLPITIVLILLLVIFVAVACWMMYRDRKNYLKKVMNIVNLVLIVLLLITILLYVSKFILVRNIINYYKKNPMSFIPFHVISALDQLLRFTVAFLIFLTFLKTLRYTRFLYNVRLAEKSIVAALPSIYSITLIAAIYFFIFVSFGHLVFGQFDTNYNTIPHAAQTIMAYCATAFHNTSFSYSRFLGSLFLGLFLVIMICILLNLFQAIFIQAYENMKPVIYEQPSEDADVVIYLRNECKRFWYSLWKTPPKPETEYSNTLFFGEDHGRTLRLKNKEIKGKNINYLII